MGVCFSATRVTDCSSSRRNCQTNTHNRKGCKNPKSSNTPMDNNDKPSIKQRTGSILLPPVRMVLPIAVEDVKREVLIFGALSGHENVVQFHNAFEDEGYMMCEGGELLDQILSKKYSRYSNYMQWLSLGRCSKSQENVIYTVYYIET